MKEPSREDREEPLPDDILARSIAALRSTPIANPNPQTLANTLEALRQAASTDAVPLGTPPVRLSRGMIHMAIQHRKLVALTLMPVCLLLLSWLFLGGATVTFAQIGEKLNKVQSMKCVCRTRIQGTTTPILTIEMEQLGNRTRSEMPGGMVTLMDTKEGKTLVLNTTSKSATLMKLERSESPSTSDLLGDLRSLADQKGDPVGEKKVGSITAQGIRTSALGRPMTVWVDPATKLPVQIETETGFGPQKSTMTFEEFQFDVTLDEQRFSMETPKGYTLIEQSVKVTQNIEENVVTILKLCNKYPAKIGDVAEIVPQLKFDEKKQLTPESLSLTTSTGALMASLSKYEKGKTYDYDPDAKPGGQELIVFWRKDKSTGKVYAVFGDLTIREITDEQIPNKK